MNYPNHSILSCYILVVTTASVTVAVTDASEINVVNITQCRKGIIAVITLRVFLTTVLHLTIFHFVV